MKQKKTGAVVVAAGLSSRMHVFKPMLPLGDSTIIRTVISSLRAGGVSTIAVVTGYKAELLQEHLTDLDIDCRFNQDYATSDMFRSACMGLSYLENKTDRLFFMPGDVPLFTVKSLFMLMDTMDRSNSSVVIPAYKGKNGHPVLINNRAIPVLLAYKGNMGLKGAISTSVSDVQVLELNDKGIVMDIDKPEDYCQLRQYVKHSTD